jgi:hypothetical protein
MNVDLFALPAAPVTTAMGEAAHALTGERAGDSRAAEELMVLKCLKQKRPT